MTAAARGKALRATPFAPCHAHPSPRSGGQRTEQDIHLSTVDHHSVDFHPWLTIQAARWLSFTSAPTRLDRWITSTEVLRAATIDGARGAQLHDLVGSLETGKRADILCLSLDTPSFFPMNNLANHLAHCENGSSIDWVMVDGEIVVRHGLMTKVDEVALRQEAAELLPEFLAAHGQTEVQNAAFNPWFAKIHERCLEVPLPD